MIPAKAARGKGADREERKGWWALMVIVLIVVAAFVGLWIIEVRLGQAGRHPDHGGVGHGRSD